MRPPEDAHDTRQHEDSPEGQRLHEPGIHSTVTDFARLRGWSTSQPRRRATWYARSWRGTTDTIGWSAGWIFGIVSTASANVATSASPGFTSAMTTPSRAFASLRFEAIFS